MIIEGARPFEFGEGPIGLLFIHGWTSSPRELKFLARKLENHCRCRGLLLDGHGLTPAALETTCWEGHLNQVKTALREMRKKTDVIYLVGLSYGAILAAHASLAEKTEGIVLLCPFIRSAKRVLGILHQSSLVKFIPPFIKSVPKKGKGPVNNPAECLKHIRYSSMPVKPLKSVVDCAREIYSRAGEITCPVLVMHSRGDRTADYSSSFKFFNRIGSADKTFIPLEKSNHIITIDYDRPTVENEVENWLLKRERKLV